MKIKKALVTGGAGFIGSHIVDRLLMNGVDVTVIDNEAADCHENFYWNEKANNHKIDICEYDKIAPLFNGVDVVFHLAAESRIQPAINNPTLAVKVNAFGTCNVLQAARESGVKRVVYSSTSSAYGVKNEAPQDEKMQKDCLNPYSVSKTCGEELCKMYTDLFGLETVFFRYFNVYGERQPVKGQYAPVIGLFLKQKKENKPCTIVGDGLQRRDYTHVFDIVEANILAATSDNKEIVGELFNVGNGKSYDIFDLVKMVDNNHIFIPPRLGEARETLSNTKKIRQMLGWKPTIDLDEWIKKQL